MNVDVVALAILWFLLILAVKQASKALGFELKLIEFLRFSKLFLVLIEAAILAFFMMKDELALLISNYVVSPLFSTTLSAIGIYSIRKIPLIFRRKNEIKDLMMSCFKCSFRELLRNYIKCLSFLIIPLYVLLPFILIFGVIKLQMDPLRIPFILAVSSFMSICFSIEGLRMSMEGCSFSRRGALWKWITTIERGNLREILMNIVLPYFLLEIFSSLGISSPFHDALELIFLGPPFPVLSMVFVYCSLREQIPSGAPEKVLTCLLYLLVVGASIPLILASGILPDLIYFQIVTLACLERRLKGDLTRELVSTAVISAYLLIAFSLLS